MVWRSATGCHEKHTNNTFRDQELRFTVHDSADYDQMKVSVFNDDKKTELIGETYVDLKEIIVPGGGQNDIWHNLQCRGKYSGEVRMEITYYDTRSPKPVVEATKQAKPVKRRPLPQNPVESQEIHSSQEHSISPPPFGANHDNPAQQLRQRDSRQYRQQHAQQQETPPHYVLAGPQPGMVAYAPAPNTNHMQDHVEIYDPQHGNSYIPGNILGRPDSFDNVGYQSHQAQYAMQNSPPSPSSTPPPPPARRVLYDSQPLYASQQHAGRQVPDSSRHNGAYTNKPYDMSPQDRPHSHYMAPTVEDASPPPTAYRPYVSPSPQNQHRQYDSRLHNVPSSVALQQGERSSFGSSHHGSHSVTPRESFSARPSTASTYRDQVYRQDRPLSSSGYTAPLPSTLVAGMDPVIAQEVADRIYHDTTRRQSRDQSASQRRYDNLRQQQRHMQGHSHSQTDLQRPFDNGGMSYNGDLGHNSVPDLRHAAQSPGVIPRKSVSPAPRQDEPRRLSGIPFGPDDFAALNPNVAPSKAADTTDPEAKIIMHDGRVVDPSDHLPEHSWAPEPESRGGNKEQQDSQRQRPGPAGRRPLRVNTRPDAGDHTNSSPVYTTGRAGDYDMSTGRVRLQKKASRPDAQPAPYSSPSAPMHSYNGNEYNARSAPRGYDQVYDDDYSNNGPPIPAKIPMQSYDVNGQTSEENAWALLEEMKSIDLGNGKGRRKNRWGSGS